MKQRQLECACDIAVYKRVRTGVVYVWIKKTPSMRTAANGVFGAVISHEKPGTRSSSR